MDSIFLLTVGFIFLGALLSNVLKWSNKDRVLKDLQGFHSTIEMQSGKEVWGKTSVYSNGMELHFTRSATNSLGDPISSFIFYGADIDKIRTIYRNHNELTEKNQLIREREVDKVSNPDFLHRSTRKVRIFFSVFNDAIGEALNVFLSRMKSTSTVLSTQSDYIKKMGTTALSSSGNEYDPILESYINKRVGVRLEDEQGRQEFCGYLKEYSSAWMSILNCNITLANEIDLDDITRLALQRDMDFYYSLYEENEGKYALDIKIDYFGKEPLKLIGVKGGDKDKDVTEVTQNYQHRLNKMLKQGESLSFSLKNLPTENLIDVGTALLPLSFALMSEARRDGHLPEEYFTHQKFLPELTLEIESTHIADVYLPRTIAIVRHNAA